MVELRDDGRNSRNRVSPPTPVQLVPDAPAWHARRACNGVDPEIFYPESGGTTRPAKKLCADCPVRAQCLQFALDNNEIYGVWGGTSERERRPIRVEKRKAARVSA